MKLQEIFDQLSNGEFPQLSIGGQPAGVINENNYARVLGHVNLALTALYTRFTLKEGELTLQLQPGKTKYELHSSFAVNVRRSQEAVRYIIDTADDPFVDDIIKVERVLTDGGVELALNDEKNKYSVTTPSALVLKVPAVMVSEIEEPPEDLMTDTLKVVYRANHPKLVMGVGYFDPARVDVQLPDTHLEPLLYYVASRVNNPVGMTNEFHAGNSYFAKYEAACQALEGKGIQVDQGSGNTRATRNGWV
jgi:hypothetical protein